MNKRNIISGTLKAEVYNKLCTDALNNRTTISKTVERIIECYYEQLR